MSDWWRDWWFVVWIVVSIFLLFVMAWQGAGEDEKKEQRLLDIEAKIREMNSKGSGGSDD